jgi:hypothetical protein
MNRTKRTKTYLVNIIIVIASFILSVVVIEFSIRFFVEDSSIKIKDIRIDPSSGYKNSYGRMCGYGWCPNQGAHSSKKIHSGGIIYDVVYTISLDRHRVIPSNRIVSSHEPSLTPRINFFGGSYMFGEGLNDNETLPYFFSKYTSSYKLINHGFHGYGAHNALFVLDRLSSYDKGSINVLLTGVHHASRSSCDVNYSTGHPMYAGEIMNNMLRPKLIGRCKGGSSEHIRDWKHNKIRKLVNDFSINSAIFRVISRYVQGPTDSEINLYISIIEEMNLSSIKRDERLIVLFMNHPKSAFTFSSYDGESIKAELVSNGVEVVDVTLGDDLGTLDTRLYLHEADKHPSKVANFERARILAEYLGLTAEVMSSNDMFTTQ